MTALVKGFGWRPVVSYPPVLRAGVRKPPRKEPAGAGRTASGLWGFDGAVAWVGDALAGVIGGGLTIAVVSLAPRGRQRCDAGSGGPRQAEGAMRRPWASWHRGRDRGFGRWRAAGCAGAP